MHINDLPEENLCLILSYISSRISKIIKYRSVNIFFNDTIIYSPYMDKKITNISFGMSEKKTFHYIDMFKNVENIYANCYWQLNISDIVNKCKNLKKVILSDGYFLNKTLKQFMTLDTIEFNKIEYFNIGDFRTLKDVKNIIIRDCNFEFNKLNPLQNNLAIINCDDKFSKCSTIISVINKIPEPIRKNKYDMLENIKHLKLQYANVDQQYISNMKSIVALELFNIYPIYDLSMLTTIKYLRLAETIVSSYPPSLEILDISGSLDISSISNLYHLKNIIVQRQTIFSKSVAEHLESISCRITIK